MLDVCFFYDAYDPAGGIRILPRSNSLYALDFLL